jgi:hypothetical protein
LAGLGSRLGRRRRNVDKLELANDIAPMLAVVASRKKDNLISYGESWCGSSKLSALKPDEEYEDLQPPSEVFHSALELVSDRSLKAHGFSRSRAWS